MEALRYPVGRFDAMAVTAASERVRLLDSMAAAPARLRAAVQGLSEEQLDTPYREGGWTVRQVVHHVTDSHLNAYVRMRWALTEERPAIKTYDEKAWAELSDARSGPVSVSLDLLEALHTRWLLLLRACDAADYQRVLVHPDRGDMTVETLVRLYEWHGRHHVAHITALRERMRWN